MRLVFGGHSVKAGFVERAVALVGANGEIAHAKRREVLEKMRALARVYAEVLDPAFHHRLGTRYVRPFHGNAQRGVAAAPTPRPYKHVTFAASRQLLVEIAYFGGDVAGAQRVEAVRAYI